MNVKAKTKGHQRMSFLFCFLILRLEPTATAVNALPKAMAAQQGQISQLLPVAEERRLIWCRNAEQCDRIGMQCDTFQTEWFNAGSLLF